MSPITRFKKRHPCHARRRTWARTAASVLGRAMFVAMIAGIPAIDIVAQQVGVFYPNIPGELLLENEHVVVQSFTIEPGQWEGIHSMWASRSTCTSEEASGLATSVAVRSIGGHPRRMAPSDGWTPSTCPKGTIPATSGTRRWNLSM